MTPPLFLQAPRPSRAAEAAELLAQYWPVLVPVALGGVAVYLLLPRARRYPPLYAAVTSGLALLSAGAFLIRNETVLAETILFYIFAGLAVVFGGLMISQRNPVHAALSFAMVVLSTCGLFLLQAAPFLMAATIIIYAGAIVVTFLFVIMLAQQAGLSSADQRSREPFLATVAGFILLGCLLCVLHRSYTGLDRYFARAEQAARASTVAEWQAILGKDDSFFTEFREAVRPDRYPRRLDNRDPAVVARNQLKSALEMAGSTWSGLVPREDGRPPEFGPETVQLFKLQLESVVEKARPLREMQGGLQPAASLPLSTASGTPPNRLLRFEDGKPVERLPARNVAGLGRALFTDYLLAVELAGTLLLVATIGAIAIAGRRPEGLR